MNLIPNTKYTIIDFSEFNNATRLREIRIKEAVGSMITYYRKGNRFKAYYLNLTHEQMIFCGWAVPVKVASDQSRLHNERRYVFLTDNPDRLKLFVVNNNVNDYFRGWPAILTAHPDRKIKAKPLFYANETI